MTTMLHPLITAVTSSDCEALMAISTRTFVETYAHANTPENMRNYIEANFSEAATQQQVSNQQTRFYFVKVEDAVMGYLKLNFGAAQTEHKEENTLEIERIYVLKAFQGKGIGRLLIEQAMAVAKQLNLDYAWLGVWEHNGSARRFYERMGFVEFGQHAFLLGDDVQNDIMLKKEIH